MADIVELDLSDVVAGPIVGWPEAERLGLALMLTLGFADSRLTNPGADGGIDVDSSEGVCQVKSWANQVGRPEVQQLFGAARGRKAVFLASRYTSQAVSWANLSGVALFSFESYGVVYALNPPAITLAVTVAHQDLSDSEHKLANRLSRASRCLTVLMTERERLRTEQTLRRRAARRNAKLVSSFDRRLPELQRLFADVGATSNLRIAPTARLRRRVHKLENELRAAARILGTQLPD